MRWSKFAPRESDVLPNLPEDEKDKKLGIKG
jgi:hypothetical protein